MRDDVLIPLSSGLSVGPPQFKSSTQPSRLNPLEFGAVCWTASPEIHALQHVLIPLSSGLSVGQQRSMGVHQQRSLNPLEFGAVCWTKLGAEHRRAKS